MSECLHPLSTCIMQSTYTLDTRAHPTHMHTQTNSHARAHSHTHTHAWMDGLRHARNAVGFGAFRLQRFACVRTCVRHGAQLKSPVHTHAHTHALVRIRIQHTICHINIVRMQLACTTAPYTHAPHSYRVPYHLPASTDTAAQKKTPAEHTARILCELTPVGTLETLVFNYAVNAPALAGSSKTRCVRNIRGGRSGSRSHIVPDRTRAHKLAHICW